MFFFQILNSIEFYFLTCSFKKKFHSVIRLVESFIHVYEANPNITELGSFTETVGLLSEGFQARSPRYSQPQLRVGLVFIDEKRRMTGKCEWLLVYAPWCVKWNQTDDKFKVNANFNHFYNQT